MNRTVDLLPENYATGRDLRQVLAFWAITGTAVILLILVFAFILRWRTLQLEASIAPLRADATSIGELNKQVDPLTAQLRLALDRHSIVARLVDEPDWCALLNSIAAACPPGMVLAELGIEKPDAGKPAAASNELPTLTLAGTSLDNERVIACMRAFSAMPQIEAVSLEELQSPPAGAAQPELKFKIKARLHIAPEPRP